MILILVSMLCSFAFPVEGSVGICMPAPAKEFKVCLDGSGFGLCGVDPPPTRAIQRTEHQGECLEACVLTPRCSSYNYFYDSTRCELFCVPFIQYAIVGNCFNYVVSSIFFRPVFGYGEYLF